MLHHSIVWLVYSCYVVHNSKHRIPRAKKGNFKVWHKILQRRPMYNGNRVNRLRSVWTWNCRVTMQMTGLIIKLPTYLTHHVTRLKWPGFIVLFIHVWLFSGLLNETFSEMLTQQGGKHRGFLGHYDQEGKDTESLLRRVSTSSAVVFFHNALPIETFWGVLIDTPRV